MSISSSGHRGSGVGSVLGGSLNVTISGAAAVGKALLLVINTDNQDTSDGETDLHQFNSDPRGNTWTKLREHTNSNGAANAGCTVSVWYCRVTTQLENGDIVVFSFAVDTAEKAASMWEFTVGDFLGVRDVQTNDQDASNGFGSLAISGLTSVERLYFRAFGKEANTLTNITETSGFTKLNNVRSRNNAAAQTCYGEFKIATSTGETSDPTHAVSGDSASIFLALEEGYTPGGGGSSGARPVVIICS